MKTTSNPSQHAIPGRREVARSAERSGEMLGQITESAIEAARGFMRSIGGALPRHPAHRPRGSGRRVV
jgi:hypothetical protein